MDAVIFIGIPGAGKTTFYREQLFDSHVRLSLDMLRTRHREHLLVRACIRALQPFCVDNTNPSRSDRQRYIPAARAATFRVRGYYFQSELDACLTRNAGRRGGQRIPDAGVRDALARLEQPALDEGFDELYHVRIGARGRFEVTPWLSGGDAR